jgi:hypothetical protein
LSNSRLSKSNSQPGLNKWNSFWRKFIQQTFYTASFLVVFKRFRKSMVIHFSVDVWI